MAQDKGALAHGVTQTDGVRPVGAHFCQLVLHLLIQPHDFQPFIYVHLADGSQHKAFSRPFKKGGPQLGFHPLEKFCQGSLGDAQAARCLGKAFLTGDFHNIFIVFDVHSDSLHIRIGYLRGKRM